MSREEGATSRARRWPYIWAAAFVVTVLVAVTFYNLYDRTSTALDRSQVALEGARNAAVAAQATADCVNEVLRARDKLTGQLHAADVSRVRGQKDAETVKAHALDELSKATTAEAGSAALRLYRAGEDAFQQTLTVYIQQSNQIRADQLAHPLGKC